MASGSGGTGLLGHLKPFVGMQISCSGATSGGYGGGTAYVMIDAGGNTFVRVTYSIAGWSGDSGWVAGWTVMKIFPAGNATASFSPGSLTLNGSWNEVWTPSNGGCSNINWPTGSI